MYVPSHVSIVGNEEVDFLAKSAETTSLIQTWVTSNIFLQEYNSIGDKILGIRMPKTNFLHQKFVQRWKNILLLNRSDEMTITWLRNGYSKLTYNHFILEPPNLPANFVILKLSPSNASSSSAPTSNQWDKTWTSSKI